MHLLFGYLINYTEVSSFLWQYSRAKKINQSVEVLVLGDSQLLSGISSATIAELEKLPKDKILFMVRPSEQPEGILDLYLQLRSQLPNLRRVYLNLSPISFSQNSVTDAHKQLYFGFGKPFLHQLTEADIRKAYFHNGYDIIWKLIIELFPLFGLNQNFSSMLSIVASPSQFYDEIEFTAEPHLTPMPSWKLFKQRLSDSTFLNHHLATNDHWTWNSYGKERILNTSDSFPKGSSAAFLKERKLSVRLIQRFAEIADQDKVKVVCFDIPFSPVIEEDMVRSNVRTRLNEILPTLSFEKVIKIPKNVLNESDYFTDYTHLNSQGRDVLNTYLIKVSK
jgi:hypothetical protein